MYEYPEAEATETWEKDGISFSLVFDRHYCGYCRFPKRPTIEQGYEGILTYAPVHGGITYSKEDTDGTMVYGFDCAHSGDESRRETHDPTWLHAECERMAKSILLASEYEEAYLLGRDNEAKANIIDAYHAQLAAQGIVFDLQDNFGAMINVLCGQA